MWALMICNFLFLIYQAICSAYDIRIQAVPKWLLLVGGFMAALARMAGVGAGTWIYIGGGFFGMVFFLISKYTKESIGYADSWMIFVLGIYLGIWKLTVILGIAFLIAGIWGMGMLLWKKKSRQATFPFLPFLMAGYLGVIGWQ